MNSDVLNELKSQREEFIKLVEDSITPENQEVVEGFDKFVENIGSELINVADESIDFYAGFFYGIQALRDEITVSYNEGIIQYEDVVALSELFHRLFAIARAAAIEWAILEAKIDIKDDLNDN